jgi:hypothetical protein
MHAAAQPHLVSSQLIAVDSFTFELAEACAPARSCNAFSAHSPMASDWQPSSSARKTFSRSIGISSAATTVPLRAATKMATIAREA